MGFSMLSREKQYLLVIAILSAILLFTSYDFSLPASAKALQHYNDHKNNEAGHDLSVDTKDEKLGYVTWLGKTGDGSDKEDVYFLATRILVYQLLHAPATKSPRGLPIIVLTTPDVTDENKKRLEADGATVMPIDFIQEGRDWLKPRRKTWMNIMSGLRAFTLTEYSRLMFLDGDMILRRPIDGIFDEPNSAIRSTLPESAARRKSDEAPLPDRYLLAGGSEVNGPLHHWPPSAENKDFVHPNFFNAGFFMLAPSQQMFDYLISVLRIKDRFNSDTMDQGILNYAHRLDGPMPWQSIPPTWNIRSPLEEDIVGNVASVHDKWWLNIKTYPALGKWYKTIGKEMLEFYKARDGAGVSSS